MSRKRLSLKTCEGVLPQMDKIVLAKAHEQEQAVCGQLDAAAMRV
jgi:hypothetical protein